MQLTDDQKRSIESEFAEWQAHQYGNSDKTTRQKLGQFFTPPPLSIKMLEKFDSLVDKDILDPTAGAGGLLSAAIIAGADPKRVYGIELDLAIATIARVRLARLGVPRHHIHVSNALDSGSYEFPESEYTYRITYDKPSKSLNVIVSKRSGDILRTRTIDLSSREGVLAFHKLATKLIDKEIECLEGENIITKFGPIFKKFGLNEL